MHLNTSRNFSSIEQSKEKMAQMIEHFEIFVLCKITFTLFRITFAIIVLLSFSFSLLVICVKKKTKKEKHPDSPPTLVTPPPQGAKLSWKGRQKPLVVFDEKLSDQSKKEKSVSITVIIFISNISHFQVKIPKTVEESEKIVKVKKVPSSQKVCDSSASSKKRKSPKKKSEDVDELKTETERE